MTCTVRFDTNTTGTHDDGNKTIYATSMLRVLRHIPAY